MQTSINNSISSSLRRHDRSVASRGRRRGRRGRSGNTKGTTMQKRANWIATRGTARRSCLPSQWRMCEKIPRQWWTRRRITETLTRSSHRRCKRCWIQGTDTVEDTASDIYEQRSLERTRSWGDFTKRMTKKRAVTMKRIEYRKTARKSEVNHTAVWEQYLRREKERMQSLSLLNWKRERCVQKIDI